MMKLFGFTYHPKCAGSSTGSFHKPPCSMPGEVIVDGEAKLGDTKSPLVFIHGLGIGLSPYLFFIRRLAATRECFVVELPEVSQSCTETVLPPNQMAEAMVAMLGAHGHAKACFIAHSYGSFVMSWVLRACPDIVTKVVLLDPTCFLLAQPDVAFNFLYRRPNNPFLLIVANFVRWELFSANVLMRHFYWYHNVLWVDELPARTAVILSGSDDITNAKAVRCHLEVAQRRWTETGSNSSNSSKCLQLLWLWLLPR